MMIVRYTVRVAREAQQGTYRQPVKRKPPVKWTNNPASTAEVWVPAVCCLLVIVFVTVVMLTCPMSP